MREPNILKLIWSVMTLNNYYMDNAKILCWLILFLYGLLYSIFLRKKIWIFYTASLEKLFIRADASSALQKILVKILSLILNTLTAWFIIRMSVYLSFCLIDWYSGPGATRFLNYDLDDYLKLFLKRTGVEEFLTTPEAQKYLRIIYNIIIKIHSWLKSLIEWIEKIRDKLRSK